MTFPLTPTTPKLQPTFLQPPPPVLGQGSAYTQRTSLEQGKTGKSAPSLLNLLASFAAGLGGGALATSLYGSSSSDNIEPGMETEAFSLPEEPAHPVTTPPQEAEGLTATLTSKQDALQGTTPTAAPAITPESAQPKPAQFSTRVKDAAGRFSKASLYYTGKGLNATYSGTKSIAASLGQSAKDTSSNLWTHTLKPGIQHYGPRAAAAYGAYKLSMSPTGQNIINQGVETTLEKMVTLSAEGVKVASSATSKITEKVLIPASWTLVKTVAKKPKEVAVLALATGVASVLHTSLSVLKGSYKAVKDTLKQPANYASKLGEVVVGKVTTAASAPAKKQVGNLGEPFREALQQLDDANTDKARDKFSTYLQTHSQITGQVRTLAGQYTHPRTPDHDLPLIMQQLNTESERLRRQFEAMRTTIEDAHLQHEFADALQKYKNLVNTHQYPDTHILADVSNPQERANLQRLLSRRQAATTSPTPSPTPST